MDLDAEACVDRGEALWCRQLGGGGFEVDNEGDNLGRDLVTASGAARLGQQAGKPSRGERVLGLVEGRPRHPEGGGDVADGNAVGLVAPYHLVAHLDEVFRVEEGVVGEQGIAHRLRMRIESTVARQSLALRVLTRRSGHALLPSLTVN
jgi:hypothetical protein